MYRPIPVFLIAEPNDFGTGALERILCAAPVWTEHHRAARAHIHPPGPHYVANAAYYMED
jgi:hypothetical protein